ncbi:MAG: DUF2256 domain-containing protein [Actinomycetota bacterium]
MPVRLAPGAQEKVWNEVKHCSERCRNKKK